MASSMRRRKLRHWQTRCVRSADSKEIRLIDRIELTFGLQSVSSSFEWSCDPPEIMHQDHLGRNGRPELVDHYQKTFEPLGRWPTFSTGIVIINVPSSFCAEQQGKPHWPLTTTILIMFHVAIEEMNTENGWRLNPLGLERKIYRFQDRIRALNPQAHFHESFRYDGSHTLTKSFSLWARTNRVIWIFYSLLSISIEKWGMRIGCFMI